MGMNAVRRPARDMPDIDTSFAELERIISGKEIVTLFQPIYDPDSNKVFAFEALSRGPEDSPLHMPDVLFDAARRHDRLFELDCLCREQAIARFVEQDLPGSLSLNIDPASLMDPSFINGRTLSFMRELGVDHDRVILELTEHARADCYDALVHAALHYREMGFSIAVDDLGAGYSNLRLLAELKPDYLKIDKYFISGIERAGVAADFVRIIVELAGRVGCKVIAEGVEKASELALVHELGVDYVQGYLLGRPETRPEAEPLDIITESVAVRYPGGEAVAAAEVKHDSVGSLPITATVPCHPETLASEVLRRFHDNPTLLAMPIVEESRVLGIVTREHIQHQFSLAFGHSIYRNARISEFMHSAPLTVDVGDSLSVVSNLATQRAFEFLYTPLIVCNSGEYVGMVSIRELLEKITQVQLEQARYSNPLTGLPGNPAIEREIASRLRCQLDFVLCYLDLDNFKAFNDYYGFERGDRMLLLVAEILQREMREDDFVGHIGGDDFVVIVHDEGGQKRIKRCLDVFAEESLHLYDSADRDAGCIVVADRQGEECCYPFASISVGALSCPSGRFTSHLEAAGAIVEIKQMAKQVIGNSMAVDRRGSWAAI